MKKEEQFEGILPDIVSSYEVYHQCRKRDLCLRYMGENPVLWADCDVTPCPCSPGFYREVLAYSKIITDEEINGKLPYSHRRMVSWLTERPPKQPRRIKPREIPVTQRRLTDVV